MTQLARRARRSYGKSWVASICASTALALPAAGSAAVNALVVGHLSTCFVSVPRGFRGPTCSPRKRAVISAFDAKHRLVAREFVTNAHFSFLLSPGRYTIRVSSANQCARRSVKARAHRMAHITIYFVTPHPPSCKQ
jgi:hypothetical protein